MVFFLLLKICTRKCPTAPCNDKGRKKSLYCAVLAGRTQENNEPDKMFSFLPLIHHSRGPSFPSLFYGGRQVRWDVSKKGKSGAGMRWAIILLWVEFYFYPSSTASGPPSPQGEGKRATRRGPFPPGGRQEEGYRYALSDNSTVGRVEFWGELRGELRARLGRKREHSGVYQKLRCALDLILSFRD